MPKFYWFTFIFSIILGWLLREYFIGFDRGLWKWMLGLLAMIYINEKTAAGEDLVSFLKKPSSVVVLIVIGLIILCLLVYEGLI